MSDQQIENAAKAMFEASYDPGAAGYDKVRWESLHPASRDSWIEAARAAAPLIRADLEQEVATLTERVRELETPTGFHLEGEECWHDTLDDAMDETDCSQVYKVNRFHQLPPVFSVERYSEERDEYYRTYFATEAEAQAFLEAP